MKKITLSFYLIFITAMLQAQGLEGIIVEPYYVSNNADSIGSANSASGNLPPLSVTWRVFADLAPGYTLQAVYGVPGHELRFTTTTVFFNDENFGTSGGSISATNVRKNAALLDSYLAVGGAAGGKVGVLKSEDTDGSLGNNTAGGPILQNNDPFSGPINIGSSASMAANDGMIPGTSVSVTFVPAPPAIFNNTQAGGTFSNNNFSAAALGGASGPTAANRVLIGQFTTNGMFCFKMNMQLGTPTSGVENFVADSAVGNEIAFTALSGCYWYPVGMPEMPAGSNLFSLFPTKAQDYITIAFNTATPKKYNVAYNILDITGKNILSGNMGMVSLTHSERVDVSSLASGMYFAGVRIGDTVSYKRFIKY